MLPTTPFSIALVCIVGCALAWAYQCKRQAARNLPPGPFPLPIIGNVPHLATSHPWKQFTAWAKIYGPIMHLQAFRYSIVILSSPTVAFDLLDTRSAMYSDRPSLTMLSMLDLSWVIPLMPYGSRWRKHRRMLHRYCNASAARTYEPVQQQKARELLRNLRDEPTRLAQHSAHAVATVLLDLTYGTHDRKTTQRYVQLAQKAADTLAQMFLPGSLLVQYIPFLRYLPSWFPGAHFKSRIQSWQDSLDASVNEPFNDVVNAMRKGDAQSSFLTEMLDEIGHLKGADYDEQETIAKNCASVVYGAGSDTTISTLMTFYLAMILYPDVQKRAQVELASVVGHGRLPEFADRPSLPYIEALVRECTRWLPVTPLGAFHATSEEDVYAGYYIPKGSIVFANQWAMLHDPVEYPDPGTFNPDRFLKDGSLNSEVRDPNTIAFGFGRRICPGRDISNATIFICVASILHVFDIKPEKDEIGRPVWPVVEVTSSLVCHPVPFSCQISFRSPAAEKLVHAIDEA